MLLPGMRRCKIFSYCMIAENAVKFKKKTLLQEEITVTIHHTESDSALSIALSGRLDTTTAPQLETFLRDHIAGKTELALDFAALEYISSAGLRVLLSARKSMPGQGTLTVRNVNEDIREIFDITGFSDILTIL